ncbi:MAG: glycosyltransferase [Cytophagales bacterium]
MNIARIAFISHPHHRGGVTSWMVDAAIECVNQGLETYFITIEPSTSYISAKDRASLYSMLQDVNNLNLITQKNGLEFDLGSIGFKIKQYTKLISKLPLGTPIIVSDDELVWMAAATMADKFPLVGVLHSDEEKYYKLADCYENYVSLFVSVSNRVKSNAKSRLKLNKPHYVIPCGIRLQSFKSQQTRQSNKILWLGRVEEFQKRTSDIVKIAMNLKSVGIDFKIEVVGQGVDFAKLLVKIEENDLQDKVQLKGWRNKEYIANALSQSKILLQTSNFEGMSVAVMEALASGSRVVSTKVSGVEDLEHDEDAQNVVKLYDIGDIQAASNLIAEILKDQQDYSNQAFLLAKKNYSIESCMKRYFSAVENIMPTEKSLHFKHNIKSSWLFSWSLANFRFWKHRIKSIF